MKNFHIINRALVAKKRFFTFFFALAASVGMTWANVAVNGKLPGKFSVSATKVVCFSQGNLQYKASTNTWRFAEEQYDFVGDTEKGNVLPTCWPRPRPNRWS